jgi:hypothetical protein
MDYFKVLPQYLLEETEINNKKLSGRKTVFGK